MINPCTGRAHFLFPWTCLFFHCVSVYSSGEMNKPWLCQTQTRTRKPQLRLLRLISVRTRQRAPTNTPLHSCGNLNRSWTSWWVLSPWQHKCYSVRSIIGWKRGEREVKPHASLRVCVTSPTFCCCVFCCCRFSCVKQGDRRQITGLLRIGCEVLRLCKHWVNKDIWLLAGPATQAVILKRNSVIHPAAVKAGGGRPEGFSDGGWNERGQPGSQACRRN